ncbi:hypothetical protein PI124_g15823 [Phytophthora idaei]|nr:hypothetical protein PI124_g15823 [Phytophthora idaei]
MVCKEDWRLLRSEKRTAVRAQGLDDGRYMKPVCRVKTGKKGVDFIHRDSAFLNYVYADTAFFERHNIQLVLTNPAPPPAAADSSKRKRVHTEETPTLIPNADQPQKSKRKKKRGQARDTTGREAPRSVKQPKTGNKKARQTKKQLRELEDKRRCAMSSLGTIWAPRHDGNDQPQEDVVIKPNPEHQTDLIRERIHVTRRLDPVDGLDSDDDTSEKRPDSATSVGTPTSEETSTTPAAILFDQGVDLDPNLVMEDSSAFLDSDAEGSGDELTAQDEVSPDASSDESESDSDDDGCDELNIESELERVKILLSAEEQEQLHLRVQESPPLYDNSQLADMAATGWAVLPVNSVVTIEDDVEVDSVGQVSSLRSNSEW